MLKWLKKLLGVGAATPRDAGDFSDFVTDIAFEMLPDGSQRLTYTKRRLDLPAGTISASTQFGYEMVPVPQIQICKWDKEE